MRFISQKRILNNAIDFVFLEIGIVMLLVEIGIDVAHYLPRTHTQQK